MKDEQAAKLIDFECLQEAAECLRTLAHPSHLDQILRRCYRVRDADEPETRTQACQTLAAFLPQLKGKARERCLESLIDSAFDADSQVQASILQTFKLIYGYLSRPERAALRRKGIRVT